MLDGSEYIECACNDYSHLVRFTLDIEDKELFLDNYLNHYLPWWKRVIIAVRYVFRQGTTPWEHFASTIITHEECKKLRKLLDQIPND